MKGERNTPELILIATWYHVPWGDGRAEVASLELLRVSVAPRVGVLEPA
jgi:hypothetical protein